MLPALKRTPALETGAARMRAPAQGLSWLGPFARTSIAEALAAAAARGELGPPGWLSALDAAPAPPKPSAPLDLAAAIDRHRELVRKLYRLQEAWRPFTIAPRLVECGRVRVDNAVDVERIGDRDRGSASIQFRGLKTCRTKACAVCYQRRKARHNAEASAVIDAWSKARGTDPLFNTLTVKHAWSDSLETTGRGIRECFRLLQQDRRWRRTRQRFGIEYVCTMEITHGEAGFHPHLHVCFLPRVGIGRRELSRMRRRLFKAWRRIVIREIGEAHAPDEKGFDLRRAKNPGEYMTKLGLELTDPTLAKEGRKGRTMIQVLAHLAAEGATRERLIFAEYERETRKQRDLTYSGGLRESRKKIAEEQEDARKKITRGLVARLPYDVWDRVQLRRRTEQDRHYAEADLLGRDYEALRVASEPVCASLAAERDREIRAACRCPPGVDRCLCPLPDAAAIASADLDRLRAALAEARRLWLAARERALHDPRADLREHAAINLDAVCRLLDSWFPGTDAADRVREWTAEELAQRQNGKPPAPPPDQ
jgi:hypothetical protein